MQKLLDIKTSTLVDSLFVGNYKTHFKGNGLEFADFREYQFGDEVKKIDFVRSQKEGKTLIRLMEEERELSVYFLFEFEYLNVSKKGVIEHVLTLLGLSALQGGDKVGMHISSGKTKYFFPAKKGKGTFIGALHKVSDILNVSLNSSRNITSLLYFNQLKTKKNLVFLFTDSFCLDEKEIKILALKNDVVIVHVFSHFENYLEGEGISGLKGGGGRIFIDLDDGQKKMEYIALRQEKIRQFKSMVRKLGGSYLIFDEKTDVYKELFLFMQHRN